MPLDVIFKDLYDTQQKKVVEEEKLISAAKDDGIGKKEEKKDQFYADQDSDNESDFEVQYMQDEDGYEDLKAVKKPIFLADLIMGLMCDDREKFTVCLESAEDLIRNQNLNDISVVRDELSQTLFRIQNKFAIEEFSLKKYRAIQALIEAQPHTMPLTLANRMEDSECSLGERLMLIECLGKAAAALANIKDMITTAQYQDQ